MLNLLNGANKFLPHFIIEKFYSSIEHRTLNKVEIAIKSHNAIDLVQLLGTGNITNINTMFPQLNYKTVLIFACEEGSIECVKVLLDNDADITISNSSGYSALMSGNIDLLNYLISRGLNLNDKIIFDCFQKLIQSNRLYNIYIIKTLLLYIQNIDYKKHNISFLHPACIAGHIEMVRLLLERGADRNAVNRTGYDALYFASLEGNAAIVKLLSEYGGVSCFDR